MNDFKPLMWHGKAESALCVGSGSNKYEFDQYHTSTSLYLQDLQKGAKMLYFTKPDDVTYISPKTHAIGGVQDVQACGVLAARSNPVATYFLYSQRRQVLPSGID